MVLSRTHTNAAMISLGGNYMGCVRRKQLLRPPLAPDTKAERFLTHLPIIGPRTLIRDAIALVLQSDSEMLPVVVKNKLQGVVFARDLAAKDPNLGQATLADVTQHEASPIPASSSISEAAAALRRHDMESIPLVEENGELGGWASFSDIYRYVIAPEKGVRGTGEFVGEKLHPMRNPVAPLASHLGITSPPDMILSDAVGLLREKGRNELTMVEDVRAVAHVNVLGMLSLVGEPSDLLVQVAGLEDEDSMVVGQIIGNLRATARKVGRICKGLQTPEIKVKTYEHRGSRRKRYEVRVTFSVPEQFVAEAKGWDLLSVSQRAIKKVEREIIRARSKIIESHRQRRTRPAEEV